VESVLIVIDKGVAEVITRAKRKTVEIVDLDALKSGAYADVERYWGDCLSARARRYVRSRYPQLAKSLSSPH